MAEWTQEQIDRCNKDMGDGIIAEIGDLLSELPCVHGHPVTPDVPPMFYPEAIHCAVVSARHMMAKEAAALVRKYLAFDNQRAVSSYDVRTDLTWRAVSPLVAVCEAIVDLSASGNLRDTQEKPR